MQHDIVKTPLREGSLFSGYNGLGRAVSEFFGSEPAWFVEFDAAPSKILAHHYPDVPNLGDITKVDWASVEPVDILTGGFPCQDVSLAGARAGLKEGTRSGLWSYFAAAIDALRPRLVVIENVRGLLSAPAGDAEEWTDAEVGDVEPGTWGVGNGNGGSVLTAAGAVCGDLASLGYDARWCAVRASDAGAPHQRFRVFILAYPQDADFTVGGQWGFAAPGEEESGRSRADVGGRGRDVVSDALMFPTPQVADATGGHASRSGARADEPLLPGLVTLFPTPRASDGEKGGPNQRGSRGDLTMSSAVQYLPTPAAMNPNDGEGLDSWLARRDRVKATAKNGNGMGMPLSIATQMLPTLTGDVVADYEALWALEDQSPFWVTTDGKDYWPAISRWAEVMGRSAPSPTLPDGKGGRHRLNPAFTEWMMGQPAGWITDPAIGLTRNEQLKACGNGVVTQQAFLALSLLWPSVLAEMAVAA